SANRKEDRKQDKRSDIMFIKECEEKLYKLIFVKSSHIVCTKIKEENDNAKLWREINDEITWVHKGYKPDKNEFEIFGIQIARKIIHLNVLIKNTDKIYHLYHLCLIEIPLQPTDEDDVFQFVGALLLLRNIIIVNIFMLFNVSKTKSEQLKK
ncbi:29693_t:CDS:1, partial [Racocetra persica]